MQHDAPDLPGAVACPHMPDLSSIPEEVTDDDRSLFLRVVSQELTAEQLERLMHPRHVYPQERVVLATHWHPEFVPMNILRKRVDAMFPNRRVELIIPTQHNQLMEWDDYAGVEVDCYSRGFNQKVQLLLHFRRERLEHAAALRAMLEHTFRYRSSQLLEFIDTVTRDRGGRLDRAARETGADTELVAFVRLYVRKIEKLLEEHMDALPADAIKNKLLRNFFDALRGRYDETLINRSQAFLKAVKEVVKERFSLSYFYRTSEVIEEARALGAGIVVPHPEQFWPILLADYDVDGYEVWNPQSQRYTEFIIDAVVRKNRVRGSSSQLLVFMGDDTHMGEKVKDPRFQDSEKGGRELGVQPAWADVFIGKKLASARLDKASVIMEYRARLDG